MRTAIIFALSLAADAALAAVAPPPLETHINATGHPLIIPAELKDGDDVVGEVPITIAPDDTVAVDRAGLTTALQPRVAPDVMTRLATISPGQTVIPLSALDDIGGVKVLFNPGRLGLELKKKPTSSNVTVISFSQTTAGVPNHEPAALSAFLNVTTSIDAIWDSPTGPPVDMNMEYEGATRLYSWVLEGEGRLDGPLDSLICPAQATCSYTHESGLKRTATRLVKELDDYDSVFTVGDISYSGFELQRGNDLLGVSLAHDATRFGKDDHLNTTTSLLTLNSAADVDVLVNGAPIEHLHLNTGSYHITDLPLLTGSNNVQLLVTTADGQVQKIVLTGLAHDTLLKPGKTQWAVNAGAGSFIRDANRAYLMNDLVANGYFRMGLSAALTGQMHAQTDSQVTMAGGDVLMLTPFGLFTVGAAGSTGFGAISGRAPGYAVNLAWDFLPPAEPTDYRSQIHIGTQYRSPGFTTPGDQLVGRGGILFPSLDPELLIAGSWTIELPHSWVVTTTGRVELPNSESNVPGAITTTGTRWGGDLSVTRPITTESQGTLWCSYGNEHLLTFSPSADSALDFTVGIRFAWQPNSRTSINAATDSDLKTTTILATTRSGTVNDGWQATYTGIDTEQLDTSMSASLTHMGRFEQTSLTQSTGWDRPPTGRPAYEQSSLRTTSAIAYADGHVAIGPPIHDGFAIVTPHASLPDSEIIVGNADAPTTHGNAWMPAVLANLPSHAETRLPLDATNVPQGYSLGDAAIDVKPPYRAGYLIEVGSDHAVSAYGVLLDQYGDPRPLVSATALSPDRARSLALFTNRAGRFGIEGVSPGQWLITAQGPRGPLTYTLTIPAGPSSLVKSGPLMPHEKGPKPHADWTTAVLPDAPALGGTVLSENR